MVDSHTPNGHAAATGHTLEMLQNIETLQTRLCAATVENRRLREALRRLEEQAGLPLLRDDPLRVAVRKMLGGETDE